MAVQLVLTPTFTPLPVVRDDVLYLELGGTPPAAIVIIGKVFAERCDHHRCGCKGGVIPYKLPTSEAENPLQMNARSESLFCPLHTKAVPGRKVRHLYRNIFFGWATGLLPSINYAAACFALWTQKLVLWRKVHHHLCAETFCGIDGNLCYALSLNW